MRDSLISCVVVGGTLNGLGVVRSLAHGGMAIYVVDTTSNCSAGWSRHCKFVRSPRVEGPDLIDTLVSLGRRLGSRPVLFLTSDDGVNAVSAHREQIEPLYRISLPSREVLDALADKTLFQALAEREGFAVPKGIAITNAAELDLLQTLSPPVIIKPADKTLVLGGQVERAVRANSLAEAHSAAARMLQRAPRVIAQEWIDGQDSDIYFSLFGCDRLGNLIGLFCGRKVVCAPPEIGITAICIAAPEAADELKAQTLNFIGHVNYRGLGSLEFKRDRRTGRFIIIEPTVGRTDWQEEIATLCGVNLPLRTYWAEIDRPRESAPESLKAVAWRSSIEYRVPPAALPRGTRVVDGHFRWLDPLPAFYYYGFQYGAARLWRRAKSLMSVLG
jgi:D-aspartate ligase